MGGRNSRQKRNEKFASIKLNPILPRKYSQEERKKLREFEKKIMNSENNRDEER